MTDHHTHDGPSCLTVMRVRDPTDKGLSTFSKCPTTDSYCLTVMMVRDPFFRVPYIYIYQV